MKDIIELRMTTKESILPNGNIGFNVISSSCDEINYDPENKEIIFKEIGQYSIRWWIATETTLIGSIQFALNTSQGDILESCSPVKKGQLAGFGAIDVRSANVRMSLSNTGKYPVVPSQVSPVTAALLAMKVPDEDLIPSFNVNEVTTLEPGEGATVDVQEDTVNPDNWLFSFGIPKGEDGTSGITPHIEASTGNWFIGDTDTKVHAQGEKGPKGDTGSMGMPEYYNFNITSANTISNPVNFDIGNIRLSFSYLSTTTFQLRFYPTQLGVNVTYDYRRFTFYDSSSQAVSRNGIILPDTGWTADDSVYSQSNEWQSSFLRQKNPDGTWSLCEYKIFASVNSSRITLWINWIYKDIAVDQWQ